MASPLDEARVTYQRTFGIEPTKHLARDEEKKRDNSWILRNR